VLAPAHSEAFFNKLLVLGSPSGEPSTTISRPVSQQICEKLWTLPVNQVVLNETTDEMTLIEPSAQMSGWDRL
jgi:hypothetical protein